MTYENSPYVVLAVVVVEYKFPDLRVVMFTSHITLRYNGDMSTPYFHPGAAYTSGLEDFVVRALF